MSAHQSTATNTDPQRGQTGLSRRQNTGTPSLLADPLEAFVNPFSLLRRMQQEVNRAFSSRSDGRSEDSATAIFIPPIELAYRDGNFVVSAELPGVNDEDIQVTITEDSIILRGERQLRSEDDSGGIRRTELRYGEFYRAIPLPDGANPDKAEAELQNGVLQIRVPVAEAKSGVRQIPVKATSSDKKSDSRSASTQQSGQGTPSSTSSSSERAA